MNVLIVGLGSIAKKHIEALELLTLDIKIYALRSKISAEIIDGITNLYNLDETTVLFDFAIISNPTNLHFKYIKLLALKGIPLFIEKPVLHSLESANQLAQFIEDKKLVTYVACNLRFHPCITYLKKKMEIENFRVNELNVYCGSFLPGWRPGKDFRTIYSANKEMGGGVHLDLFHELDYTTWLFGFPNKSISILRSVSTLDIDAYDYANYVLEYDTFTASIILNYYRRKPKRKIEIVLENETLIIDLITNTIKNELGDCLFNVEDFKVKDTYFAQLEYFISCLKYSETPMNSFKDSLENLKICLHDEK